MQKTDIKTDIKEVSEETLSADPIKNITPGNPELNGEEAKKLYEQRMFLSTVAKPSFQQAADARRKYDQEWVARNLFWRGYQFSRYLPQSQTVVLSSRQSARVPINYVASTMRAIRNQVTSFRPKWEVLPSNPSNVSSNTQARYTQRLLDYYFDHLKLKKKIKETITQALMYSIGGPWEVTYDEEKREVRIWLLDPFDFFIDPLAEEHEDAEFMIKAVRRSRSEVVTKKEWNIWARKEISSGDSKIAASQYKQFMIQALKQVSPRIVEGSPMVILYQGDFKRRHENGKPYMVRCIWTDQNVTPLYYEEIDTDEFDYVVYRGDLNPKDIYGESWMKHVMPINRTLNSLETSAFEYNYRVAKGRIVVDRDSGVRAIHNVHGEIISKNRGAEVRSLDMAPLPVAVPQQIERMWRYMEDISGVHEASLGRIPTGVKTGIGIAELKQSDATSQDDLVDNLEDFLQEVAFKLLKKIAKNYKNYKIIKDLGIRDNEDAAFAVIGKGFDKKASGEKKTLVGKENQVKIGPDWLNIVTIGDDNNIRVRVGSWLGYTKEALQQKVESYFQMQLIDQSTALKLLEFGNVDQIIQQTRIESLLKRPANPQNPNQPDQMSLAMTENDMLLEGKEMPVSENDDHIVHIAIHQEALDQGYDDEVLTHIRKHQIFLGSESSKPVQSVEPEQPPMQDSSMQGPSIQQPPMPGQPQVPGVPGQNLPQQNLPQATSQLDQFASQQMSAGQ